MSRTQELFLVSLSQIDLQRLRRLGYLLSVLLFVLPLGELATTAWPFHWGQPLWRFSVGGMAGASSATMIVGLFLSLVLVLTQPRRRSAWVIFAVATMTALAYFGGAALFSLDAIQLGSTVSQQDPVKYKVTAAWILVKLALSGIAFLAIAVASVAVARVRRIPRTDEEPPHVIGMRNAASTAAGTGTGSSASR
jgi:hypothetical protein